MLSNLIHYRQTLQELDIKDPGLLAHTEFGAALHQVQSSNIQLPDLSKKLESNYREISQSMSTFHFTLREIIKEVDRQIESMAPAYFAESYRLYEQEMCHESTEYILDRRLNLDPKVETYLRARLMPYSDWHHAGMILRPGREDWIEHLVGADPLYLVDVSYDLLEPAKLRWNESYQRRLRVYTINENNDKIVHTLPYSQFGFCLAYNFFNYKPIEVIKQYLIELHQLLKPGGTLIMTFNDCDRAGGVKLAERSFMCYTPGGIIKSLLTTLGYQITHIYNIDSACTWVEATKPGQLTSLRGGQSLAKINPIVDIDNPQNSVYIE